MAVGRLVLTQRCILPYGAPKNTSDLCDPDCAAEIVVSTCRDATVKRPDVLELERRLLPDDLPLFHGSR
jgi:hypothetical protein